MLDQISYYINLKNLFFNKFSRKTNIKYFTYLFSYFKILRSTPDAISGLQT